MERQVLHKLGEKITSQPTVFGLSAEVVTILSITGAISNALKPILAWES